MSILDMLLLGVGVSADAFAVAICKGLCLNHFDRGYATKIAILFGFFQGMMTFLGYYVGYAFIDLIKKHRPLDGVCTSILHWRQNGL